MDVVRNKPANFLAIKNPPAIGRAERSYHIRRRPLQVFLAKGPAKFAADQPCYRSPSPAEGLRQATLSRVSRHAEEQGGLQRAKISTDAPGFQVALADNAWVLTSAAAPAKKAYRHSSE
jgi:hypothetical protein